LDTNRNFIGPVSAVMPLKTIQCSLVWIWSLPIQFTYPLPKFDYRGSVLFNFGPWKWYCLMIKAHHSAKENYRGRCILFWQRQWVKLLKLSSITLKEKFDITMACIKEHFPDTLWKEEEPEIFSAAYFNFDHIWHELALRDAFISFLGQYLAIFQDWS